MCTFDISLDNEVVDRLKPFLGKTVNFQDWLQQQIDELVNKIIVVEEEQVRQSSSKKHSLSNLRGIVKGNFDFDKIREDYVKEKFGI